jgi:hypothetical protein
VADSGIFWPVASEYSITSCRTLGDRTATAIWPPNCDCAIWTTCLIVPLFWGMSTP